MLEFDLRAVHPGGLKAHLDLAGFGKVRLRLPAWADLPGEDQPVGRLPNQYPAPVEPKAMRAKLVTRPSRRGSIAMVLSVSPDQVYSGGHQSFK